MSDRDDWRTGDLNGEENMSNPEPEPTTEPDDEPSHEPIERPEPDGA